MHLVDLDKGLTSFVFYALIRPLVRKKRSGEAENLFTNGIQYGCHGGHLKNRFSTFSL